VRKQEIVVTIDGEGNAHIEVQGLEGPSCEDETRDLENALGKPVSRKRTAEYYRKPAARITQKHQ
jgi:hypothetical protein